MIVIGSNTSDNGQSRFTEDISHFVELRQIRQLALLKRSAKEAQNSGFSINKLAIPHLYHPNMWMLVLHGQVVDTSK